MSLAREMGVSDAALHLYANQGKSPLMVYKALVMLVDPSAADTFERKLVVYRAKAPSQLPTAALKLANKYDALRDGNRLALDGGGWMTLVDHGPEAPTEIPAAPTEGPQEPAATAPAELAAAPAVLAEIAPAVETQTMTIPTAYGDIRVQVPVMQRSDQSDDLLLALAMRLKAQRDDAWRELTGLRKQLLAEQSRNVSLQNQLTVAQEEVRVYEELMQEQSQPQHEKAVSVVTTKEQVTSIEEKLRTRAPSLAEEFKRLPKTMAR